MVPIGWRPRTRGDKIGPSYLTRTFSGAQKWADWLHNRCLLRGPIGVGIRNSPKSCPAHALHANTPSFSLVFHFVSMTGSMIHNMGLPGAEGAGYHAAHTVSCAVRDW